MGSTDPPQRNDGQIPATVRHHSCLHREQRRGVSVDGAAAISKRSASRRQSGPSACAICANNFAHGPLASVSMRHSPARISPASASIPFAAKTRRRMSTRPLRFARRQPREDAGRGALRADTDLAVAWGELLGPDVDPLEYRDRSARPDGVQKEANKVERLPLAEPECQQRRAEAGSDAAEPAGVRRCRCPRGSGVDQARGPRA